MRVKATVDLISIKVRVSDLASGLVRRQIVNLLNYLSPMQPPAYLTLLPQDLH